MSETQKPDLYDRVSELEAVNERLRTALRAQIGAHHMLCQALGLDEQAHLDGTAQARAALKNDPVEGAEG